MNERYVSIKVDREEMPDVDQIYQQALQLQGEHGGQPLRMSVTEAAGTAAKLPLTFACGLYDRMLMQFC